MKIIKYIILSIILCLLFVGVSFASNDTSSSNIEKITKLNTLEVKDTINEIDSNNDNIIQETTEKKINKKDINTKKTNKIEQIKTKKTVSATTNTTYNYHVNSSTGTNSNSENSANPYKTSYKSINKSSSGNSIYLYNGNHNLTKNNTVKTLKQATSVNKLTKVKIVAGDVNAHVGDKVRFTGYVRDEFNKNVSSGKLLVKFGGKTQFTSSIKNGKFNYTYSIPSYSAKKYKLQYVYVQNNNYTGYELNKTLNIMKPFKVKIVAGDINAHLGDKVNINGYVIDEYNKIVSTGKIVIKLNGKTHITTNITKNKINYTCTIPNYGANKYKLQYVYVQNNKYDRYELNKTLFLNNDKIKTTTILVSDYETYNGDFLTMKGRVVDSNQKNVNKGVMFYKLNGNTVESTPVVNGTFEFKKVVHDMGLKNYELTFVYGTNEVYDRSEANRVLTVTKKQDPRTKTIINATSIIGYAGEEIIVNGTVYDNKGNPVKDGRVVLKLNGKTVDRWGYTFSCPVVNGTFESELPLPNYAAKDYNLKYVYVQNDEYARYELNKTLTIKKQPSETLLIIYDDLSVYEPYAEYGRMPGDTLSVGIITTGLKTQNLAVNGNVSLKVDGKLYKINNKTVTSTFKDGKTTFKYVVPKNEKIGTIHYLTFVFSGSSNLYSSEVKCRLSVVSGYDE